MVRTLQFVNFNLIIPYEKEVHTNNRNNYEHRMRLIAISYPLLLIQMPTSFIRYTR